MGKNKRIQIPKNRDIEEIVEQDERNRYMERKDKRFDEKRENFIKEINVQDKKIETRLNDYIKRRDAEMSQEKRQQDYWKAMNKLEEKAQEEK